MGIVGKSCLAIAAIWALTQPANAQDDTPVDVVAQCPGEDVTFQNGLCVASSPSPTSKYKNAAPVEQAEQQSLPIPKLELPPFDRTSENYRLAMEIAQITLPPEQLERLLRTELPPAMEVAFGMDPAFAEFEAENPGFIAYMTSRFTDFLATLVMANFDFFLDATAIDFVNGLTLPELREYRDFLRTSAGKKLMVHAPDLIRFDGAMMGQSLSTDDPKVTDAIVTVDRSQAEQLAQLFTPQETKEMMAFIERPVFKKIQRINAASSQSAMDRGFDQLIEDASVEQLMDDIFDDFFADK